LSASQGGSVRPRTQRRVSKNCFGNFVQAQETRGLAPLAAYGLQKYGHLKQEVQLRDKPRNRRNSVGPALDRIEKKKKRGRERKKRGRTEKESSLGRSRRL